MNNNMKIIAMTESLPIDVDEALIETTAPLPAVTSKDLLVKVHAVSVNPVDAKVRAGAGHQDTPKILGWDAAGRVEAVGEDVQGFSVGDDVFYAGDLTRQGSNAEYQTVDYRIVAKKPSSMNYADAAALPLTSITAWETLFDHMNLGADSTGNLLVVGGAGGVGSMIIQLAKAKTSLTVIASASRPESTEWCRSLGADHVVDHTQGLSSQVQELGGADFVFSAFTAGAEEELANAMNPQSHLVLIDDPEAFNIGAFKAKSITVTPEFMFTRSMFETPDMSYQSELLTEVAQMVDGEVLKGTATEYLRGLSTETFRVAHQKIESSRTIGKIVVSF
ncbi:NADPH:quinone reductase [Rothia nasimurium]|uniref:Zinc-type alcohol dehydrogenase-like protein n=2 Tax=Micrococcaceae TaxID=1268 RepID=A0A1Y1RN90_9MICC|nr:NADPH:quinone reductase [Rothia nasimurium]